MRRYPLFVQARELTTRRRGSGMWFSVAFKSIYLVASSNLHNTAIHLLDLRPGCYICSMINVSCLAF